jgi:hypothetical protein
MLVLIMENQITSEDYMSVYQLKNEMEKAGYTAIATSVGIRALSKNGMVQTYKEIDHYNNGEEFLACRLTDSGEGWILNNQNKLEFNKIRMIIQLKILYYFNGIFNNISCSSHFVFKSLSQNKNPSLSLGKSI